MLVAITRDVSPAISRCELTHLTRESIDFAGACAQHDAYESCLEELSCAVRRVGAGSDLPDSVFVEDIAVVFDDLAILTRPGAASRRGETAAIADALRAHRSLQSITSPATLDGGDVLVIGRRVYVGESSRTNGQGIAQLTEILKHHGYRVQPVRIRDCLHLKSAVTALADDLLLMNREWVDDAAFSEFGIVEVDPSEPFGANALRLGACVVHPAAFSRTRARIEARGIDVRSVDMSELAKAEGGVTCCSLVFEARENLPG